MSEKEILSSLLTDEAETLNRLVAKAQRVFKINKRTGEILLLPPRSKLTDRQLIAVYLLGRYFASKLELTQADSLTFDDLRKLSNLEEGSITARLSDLRKEGLVETGERGIYRINYQSLESFGPVLEEIERGVSTTTLRPGLPVTISIPEALQSINLASYTDTDSIVLTLRANRAYPVASPLEARWLAGEEIIEWARNHGSLMRPDTVMKYTLPQDPVLKPLIIKRKEGKHRTYQLSRQGLERAQQILVKEEASGKG